MAMTETITIDGHTIGAGSVFVVAEVGQAHEGSLGAAHAHIDAAADAGADAVKFQTHIADAESTRDERFRVDFSKQDATRYDYWLRMEFSEEGWRGLAGHALDRGLVFFSSPFSLEAVALLERVGVPVWKVGSGEVDNHVLLERIATTGLPVILSSGMSDYAALDRAVALLRGRSPLAVLQCTTAYPVVTGATRAERACGAAASDTNARSASPTTRAPSTRRSPPSRWARRSSRCTSRSAAECSAPTLPHR